MEDDQNSIKESVTNQNQDDFMPLQLNTADEYLERAKGKFENGRKKNRFENLQNYKKMK